MLSAILFEENTMKIGVKHFFRMRQSREKRKKHYENRGFRSFGQNPFGIIHTWASISRPMFIKPKKENCHVYINIQANQKRRMGLGNVQNQKPHEYAPALERHFRSGDIQRPQRLVDSCGRRHVPAGQANSQRRDCGLIECAFCGYEFPAECGFYGCPNCEGEGLEDEDIRALDGSVDRLAKNK